MSFILYLCFFVCFFFFFFFFFFLALAAILFSGNEPVEGHLRNISVKLFYNRAIGLGQDVV